MEKLAVLCILASLTASQQELQLEEPAHHFAHPQAYPAHEPQIHHYQGPPIEHHLPHLHDEQLSHHAVSPYYQTQRQLTEHYRSDPDRYHGDPHHGASHFATEPFLYQTYHKDQPYHQSYHQMRDEDPHRHQVQHYQTQHHQTDMHMREQYWPQYQRYYDENVLGFGSSKSKTEVAKSTAKAEVEGSMGSMDPASMYFDPTTTAHGAAQMPMLPEVGTPLQIGQTGLGLMKKIPGVGGVVGAVEDAGKMTVGLAKGEVPSLKDVGSLVSKIPGAELVGQTLKGVADVGSIAAGLAQGKLPTADQASALIKTVPGLSEVSEIVDMAGKGAKLAGQAAGVVKKVEYVDDGKPKTCWVKSHGRGFGSLPSGMFSRSKTCKAPKELSGGFCYDPCQQGKGVGPVCWGSCPAGTKACGVLCQLEGETCTGFATKITKDVIATGVKGVGQDYFGAVKGALSVAGDFAYPVCPTMNEINLDEFNDIDPYWLGESDYEPQYYYYYQDYPFQEEDHRYYDQYFLM